MHKPMAFHRHKASLSTLCQECGETSLVYTSPSRSRYLTDVQILPTNLIVKFTRLRCVQACLQKGRSSTDHIIRLVFTLSEYRSHSGRDTFRLQFCYAQLIGHEPLWQSVMGDRYLRVMKVIAEELVELSAYILITLGTIEFAYAWSRLPRNGAMPDRRRRRPRR